MEKIDILKKINFYTAASNSLKEKLVKEANYQSLPAGFLLFPEGAGCSQVGFVGRGNIRVFKTGETGREITLYHVQAGDGCVLNLSCGFSNRTYPATALVTAPTEIVTYPTETFKNYMREESIQNFVFNLFATRFSQVITLIEEIVFRKMDQRLTEFLSEKFENKGRPIIRLKITQEQIATELGTAREVVNRLLKEFERIGAIENARGLIKLKKFSLLAGLK
jgi:CRP/FNR family transcriptional regulator